MISLTSKALQAVILTETLLVIISVSKDGARGLRNVRILTYFGNQQVNLGYEYDQQLNIISQRILKIIENLLA